MTEQVPGSEASKLPQVKAAVHVAIKKIFLDADGGSVYNAVRKFREVTKSTPWAESDLPREAEEIREIHGEDPLFNFTWRLLELTQDRPRGQY